MITFRACGVRTLFQGFLTIALLSGSMNAYALQTILDRWRVNYPDSNSDDLECQMCHVSAAGNAPWNSYGAQIRNVLAGLNALGGANNQQIDEALSSAESVNVDNDPSGSTALDEINNHYQPGWTVGNNNTTFDENPNDRTQLVPSNGQPPAAFSLDTTRIDPAVPSANTLPAVTTGAIAVRLQTVANGFTTPVMAARVSGLSGFLFVVQQDGEIWRVNLNNGSKVMFHDVDAAPGVPLLFGGERGLLGLAFDPDYLTNGYFYTYQSESMSGAPMADFSTTGNADHQTVISEWQTSDPSSPNSFSVSSSRRVLMRIDQPDSNHNAGMLNFGPDGFLYIATGDGGGSNDEGEGHGLQGNGRDNTNPLGAILRINPRGSNSDNGEYGVPVDNPFVGEEGVDEIYAYGFRNPYRFSFDRQCFDDGQMCDTLMLGDVGQAEVEEIDNVVAGGNYGWNWKEGSFFFYRQVASIYNNARYISTDPPPSVPEDLIDPVAEYNSGSVDGRSAVGGYIYRGSAIPQLRGFYVFADFFNRLYYLDQSNQVRRFIASDIGNIGGFGEDQDRELYVVTQDGSNGLLQKITDAEQNDDICMPIKTSSNTIAVICL